MDMEKLMGGTWSEGRFFFFFFFLLKCFDSGSSPIWSFIIIAAWVYILASVPERVGHLHLCGWDRIVWPTLGASRPHAQFNVSFWSWICLLFFFSFRFGYEERRGSAVSASATSPHSINSGTWQWPTSTKHLRVGATGRLPFWVTFHLHYYYFLFKKKKLPFSPRLVEQISREKKTSVNAPCRRAGQRDLATHVPSPSHYPLRNPFLFTSPLADRNTSSPTDLQSTASLSLSLSQRYSLTFAIVLHLRLNERNEINKKGIGHFDGQKKDCLPTDQ